MSEFPKNLIEVTGEVSDEPKVRTFGDNGDRSVTNLNLQVSDERNRRLYIRIVAWDDLGESVQNAKEGTRFYVKGTLVKQKNWTGSDGSTRYGTFEIHADEITKLGTRSGTTKKVPPAKKMEF